jgi:hypothetical protein
MSKLQLFERFVCQNQLADMQPQFLKKLSILVCNVLSIKSLELDAIHFRVLTMVIGLSF